MKRHLTMRSSQLAKAFGVAYLILVRSIRVTNPPPLNFERQVIAMDRLQLLSLAYYISGAIGAAFVSFLLIHFFLLLGLSFVPASQWNAPTPTPRSAQY